MTSDDVVIVTPTPAGTYLARVDALGLVAERPTEAAAREELAWAIAALAETSDGRARLLASPLRHRFADRWARPRDGDTPPARPPTAGGTALARLLATTHQPVLLYFWAAWCQPCRTVAPVVDVLAARFAEQLRVVKLDVEGRDDDAAELATELQVLGLPTLIGIAAGEERLRICGGHAADRLATRITSFVEDSTTASARRHDHA